MNQTSMPIANAETVHTLIDYIENYYQDYLGKFCKTVKNFEIKIKKDYKGESKETISKIFTSEVDRDYISSLEYVIQLSIIVPNPRNKSDELTVKYAFGLYKPSDNGLRVYGGRLDMGYIKRRWEEAKEMSLEEPLKKILLSMILARNRLHERLSKYGKTVSEGRYLIGVQKIEDKFKNQV